MRIPAFAVVLLITIVSYAPAQENATPPAGGGAPPAPASGMALQAATEQQEQRSTATVAVVPAGNVDAALVKRIADYLAAELKCNVAVRQPVSASVLTNEAPQQIQTLSLVKTSKDTCLVALAVESPAIKFSSHVGKDAGVGIVNLTVFQMANAAEADKDERCARRVEKETMRVVGKLLGLGDCFDPHCAMTPVDSPEMLDSMGRNYCPPCQGKAADRIQNIK